MFKVVTHVASKVQPITAGQNTAFINGVLSSGFNAGLPSLPWPPGCRLSTSLGIIHMQGNNIKNAKML